MRAQETAGIRWRIRTRHLKDEQMPFHEWLWTGEPVKADSLGRLNGRMWRAQWASVRCVYAQCPGEALIRIGDMVEVLPVLVKRSAPQPILPAIDEGPPSSPHETSTPASEQVSEQPELTPELLTTGRERLD